MHENRGGGERASLGWPPAGGSAEIYQGQVGGTAVGGLAGGITRLPHFGPTVKLSPDAGPPGTTVSGSGSGFPAGTQLTVDLDIVGGDGVGRVSVDGSGTVSGTFTIPGAAEHTVLSVMLTDRMVPVATGSFQVTGRPDRRPGAASRRSAAPQYLVITSDHPTETGVRPMRLAASAHTSQPWLIHEITPDFRLEDVWALPTPGGPDDFPVLVSVLEKADFEKDAPRAARLLWSTRRLLGRLLGLDRKRTGLGARVPSLRDRLPDDLRAAAEAHPIERGPFTFLYQRDNERAAEIANRTMHGVLHLGWVPDGAGGWRGQMAVLVKPNGLAGAAYMALIKPFRYAIVYPAMLRAWERRWREQEVSAPGRPA